MRAVIYCRVSTKEQVANLSLPTQERACREYCARHSYEVAEVFTEAESAKTSDRTELQRMLAYCERNKKNIDAVVVYNLSRFARDFFQHGMLRLALKSLRITLRSVTEPIDDTPGGAMMEAVIAGAAQFDNLVRAERTKAGMGPR